MPAFRLALVPHVQLAIADQPDAVLFRQIHETGKGGHVGTGRLGEYPLHRGGVDAVGPEKIGAMIEKGVVLKIRAEPQGIVVQHEIEETFVGGFEQPAGKALQVDLRKQ